jgi:hypothetical protein
MTTYSLNKNRNQFPFDEWDILTGAFIILTIIILMLL